MLTLRSHLARIEDGSGEIRRKVFPRLGGPCRNEFGLGD